MAAQHEVERLRTELTRAEAHLVEANRQRMEAAILLRAQGTPPDLTEITAQMQSAEATNRQVREKRKRHELEGLLTTTRAEADRLTTAIAEIDTQKTALLAAAPFPVPGLGVETENGSMVVTHNGIPLEQCAHSVQLRVGIAIAMAVNPQCRVILIRDGATLDADNQAWLAEISKAREFQVWLELVGDGDQESFVIVDGGIQEGGQP